MSTPTGTRQIQLDGETISVNSHLTKEEPGKCLGVEKDREWYCRACGHRVTEAVSRDGEWGHDLECEWHIAGISEDTDYDDLDYARVGGELYQDAVSKFVFCDDCDSRARPDSVAKAFKCDECGPVRDYNDIDVEGDL